MIREDKHIIGLCGRQGSGKTMLANYLTENMGYKRIYVAEALKNLCSKMLNMSIEEMDEKKNVISEYVLTESHAKLISEECDIDFNDVMEAFGLVNFKLQTVRQAYQFLGTDLIRKFNPNWHIEKMLSTIKPNEKYVVDDVRFPNEVEALKYHGSKLIFIVRPIVSNVNHHMSEESIKWNDFENLIINNTTKEHAVQQLIGLIESDKNEYADKYVGNYQPCLFLNGSNYIVKETKTDYPIEVTVSDRNIGWVICEYNSMEHPLEIEDMKFKI